MRCPLVCALSLLLFASPLAGVAGAHVPHDVAEGVAVSPAFADDHVVLGWFMLLDHRLLGRSDDAGRSWLLYGHPALSEGPVRLVFSPDFGRDETVFLATSQQVWRSTDGGLHWAVAGAGFGGAALTDLAISPDFGADGVLLAATDAGAWLSSDRGDDWAPADTGLVETSLRVAGCAPPTTPGAPAVLYTGDTVLQRSLDGGQSWQSLTVFSVPMACVAFSAGFAADETLAVSFGRYGGGVRVSLDGGVNTAPMTTDLTDMFVNQVVFASDGTLLAAGRHGGAFRAPAVGQPWVTITNGFDELSDMTDDHNREIAISPDFPQDQRAWIAAFEGLYDTLDGGSLWFQDDVYNHLGNPQVAFSPGWPADPTLVLGNSGDGMLFGDVHVGGTLAGGGGAGLSGAAASAGPAGLASLGSVGTTSSPDFPAWRASGALISNLYMDTLALSPSFAQDDTLFAGYVGLWRSQDRGLSWKSLTLPGFLARDVRPSPSFAQDHELFLGTAGTGLFRSLDAGDSWTALRGGAPPDFNATRLAVSPALASDGLVLAGSREQGAWASTDAGDSWAPLPGLPAGEVRALAVSPTVALDGMLAVGFVDRGLWLSHDDGASFSRAEAGLPAAGLPDAGPLTVESVAFSPAFAQDGVAFLSTLEYGLFRSTDAGASWTHLDGGLPLAATRVVALSPSFAQDRRVLLGTWDWVWWSEDAGDTWQRLPGLLRTDNGYDGVHYEGAWSELATLGAFGTTIHRSELAGAATWIDFRGHRAAFFAVRQPSGGTALIELDGRQVAAVSLQAARVQPSAEVWSTTLADDDWHRLRVINAGGRHDTVVASDGFETRF